MKTTFQKIIVTGLLLSASAAISQTPPPTPQGFITGKAFTGITGTAVANLTNATKFPDSADTEMFLPYFEWNATGDIFTQAGNWADNYGTQIRGYFYPPASGDYVFYLAADDNASLYLSTNSNPANKKLIAQETSYSGVREYLSSANSTVASKDSSQFAATEWPIKDPSLGGAKITLQANQPYYIEALAKDGTGGDHLSAAVMDPNFAIDSSLPIPGQYLSSDRTLGPVSIVTQPQSQSVPERGTATFRVQADGTPPYSYQWRKNGTDITDATNQIYSVASATVGDNDAKFSAFVTGAQGTSTSAEATLTVVPDTNSPALLGAKGSASLTEVALNFSEALAPASATATANYTITNSSGILTVTAASLSPDGRVVTLTTAPQTLGTKYTVWAQNIQDTAAAPNTLPRSKAVFFPTGKLLEMNGMIVFEAESYDRNTDGLWVPDTSRGTPSGGISMVVPNGAGGNEAGTQIEFDVEFANAATYYVWYRASSADGNDDSSWFWLDGARPVERSTGNQASMTGFSGQADFVWRSDAQDAPDPFTVDIPSVGAHVVGVGRREDGAYMDKFIITTNSAYTPTGFGPAETRQGAPPPPTVTLTSPTAGQVSPAGSDIVLSATASGSMGLEITRVGFLANGTAVGEATNSPFTFTWQDVPEGIYAITAVAADEIRGTATSSAVVLEVEKPQSPSSAKIAWVSFHSADGTPSSAAATAGFTNASDVGYTRLLADNGHQVTRVVTSGSPNATLLNAFDLVIISRSVPSGDYQDPPETLGWNSLTAPTMIMGGYVIRNSRLGFTTGGTIPDTAGAVKLTVTDTNHPIFAGVALDSAGTMVNTYADLVYHNNVVQRGISVNTDPVAGDGAVLATVGTIGDPAADGMIIGEWQAGAIMGNTAGDVLGGHRLVFLTGSRENNGLTSEGAGIYDLGPDGAKMFLNAVNYMAGTVPAPERPALSATRTPTGLSITYEGTLESATTLTGPWNNVPNATSPYTVTNPSAGQQFYRAKR